MELELSEEQVAFVSTTRRFLAAECPTSRVRTLQDAPAGFDPELWARGAALGWTSLLVPAADGGGSLSEHGLADLVLVAEEMGRLVAPGPLVPVNVVAESLGRHGSDHQRSVLLPGLLDGSAVATWCGPTGLVAETLADRIIVRGTCTPIEAAAQSSHLLVAVELAQGPTQLLVATDAPGVRIEPLDGLDLVRRHGSVRLVDVEVDPHSVLGAVGGAAASIERQCQVAVVLQCAETVGAMEHVFEMTLEYLGDRYSFGRPLSSYQALKHRLADDKTSLESCHAIATAAARAVAEERADAADVVDAAAAWIGPRATELIQDCIQLHGGIGVTWEHDLHLYLRRATVNRASHGTPEEHAERIAARLMGASW